MFVRFANGVNYVQTHDKSTFSMADNMCSSLPLSLITSLINQDFIIVSRLLCKGQQGAFLHQINFLLQQLFQLANNVCVFEQAYFSPLIKRHQNVHIAFWPFFTARIGSKQPCFGNRLSGKIPLECRDNIIFCCTVHNFKHL